MCCLLSSIERSVCNDGIVECEGKRKGEIMRKSGSDV